MFSDSNGNKILSILEISSFRSLEHLAFDPKMRQYTRTIAPGVQLGKENGLSLLLDAETYDYAYSKQVTFLLKLRRLLLL